MLVFYDYEVFFKNWLVVFIEPFKEKETVIVDNPKKLERFYNKHKNDIWVGYNSRHYDQFIQKGILTGFNPKEINDHIIVEKKSGYSFSSLLNKIFLINYDVMPNPPIGLKTLEGFMGSNIKQSDVSFNIDRSLTEVEIEETIKYCRHDVEQTIEVFTETYADFAAMMTLVKQFNLPLSSIGKTEAGITAAILECQKTQYDDEFNFIIEKYVHIEKYREVYDWFVNQRTTGEVDREEFYNRELIKVVAGVPHKFGWGGVHGARKQYVYRSGNGTQCWHIDVTSYYPSYLIAHDRITRSARHPERYSWAYFYQIDLKRQGRKKERLPYKKMLNALSGAMKDPYNPAYDPCMNNTMVVNCQLSALMLIEMLEEIPGFKLIQSNTDGLIVEIPDTDEAFDMMDDICYEWETICSTEKASIKLDFDEIEYLYQKDVNNYVFKFAHSDKIERKGTYVKELSKIDNDLPIVNAAMVAYMTKGVPVETTINNCDELIQFQKIVKLSDKYEFVKHNAKSYHYKCYRVFASTHESDGKIYKCREGSNPAKFGNTPDHCFIDNDNINGVKVPKKLDRQYYIDLAKKRLKQFGLEV